MYYVLAQVNAFAGVLITKIKNTWLQKLIFCPQKIYFFGKQKFDTHETAKVKLIYKVRPKIDC